MLTRLSIIVPAFNVGKALQSCIDSIYRDFQPGIQVIVIDDGSSDETSLIISENRGKRGFFDFSFSENHGRGAARNLGIDRAEGEWIWFVDADDMIVPGSLQTITSLLETETSEIVIFGYEKHGSNGVEVQVPGYDQLYRSVEEFRDIFDELFSRVSYNSCWNKLFRSSIIRQNEIAFNDDQSGEDADFVTQYLPFVRSARIVNAAFYQYYYQSLSSVRHHQDSCTYFASGMKQIDKQRLMLNGLGIGLSNLVTHHSIELLFGTYSLVYRELLKEDICSWRSFKLRLAELNGVNELIRATRPRCLHGASSLKLAGKAILAAFPLLAYLYLRLAFR